MKTYSKFSVLALLISITACAPKMNYFQNPSNWSSNGGSTPTLPDTPSAPDTSLGGICTTLDFSEVIWPTSLAAIDRKAFALAANITGSFEGNKGWGNITNNFDKQGMSLGLNQQNLGQGSLQPLLTRVVKNNPNLMQILFSAANLKSLTQMLTDYQGTSALKLANQSEKLFSTESALSPLDIGYSKVTIFNASTDTSVAWAKSNLYLSNGTTFKTDWKNSFVTLAVSPTYRSLQVEAAQVLFNKAKNYFKYFKFTQLRSLLVMYDFVVQNGGFNTEHQSAMASYDLKNPSASELTRLLKLLDIRAATANPEYIADVIARKSTIIKGTGVVHGSNRNLPKEYCYDGTQAL